MNKVWQTTAVLVALLIGVATGSLAAPAADVRHTVHNMAANVTNDPAINALARHQISNNETQICIFCHTPHNADSVAKVPLWNKSLPSATVFNMYTSSRTLSQTSRTVTAPSKESLLCLSCHDGKTAINVVHNARGGIAAANAKDRILDIGGDYDWGLDGAEGISLGEFNLLAGSIGKNLGIQNINGDLFDVANQTYGKNLSDDHPISMSYNGVLGDKPTAFKSVVSAETAGVRFYGSTKRLECGSCHDPHVPYGMDTSGSVNPSIPGSPQYAPFLRVANTGSQLCLACHVK